LTVLVLCGVTLIGAGYAFENDYPLDRPHFKHSHFSVTRSDGTTLSFSAEVAVTPSEQSYGLMFVHSIAQDRGMIFPYQPAAEVSFWMRNTLIPLDMLFIAPNHKISRIVTNAVPQDLTPIPSLEPVSAVIEIKGGLANEDQIKVGDQVMSPDVP
jgi:uncharacterized membrane protein (UPF0127 family)